MQLAFILLTLLLLAVAVFALQNAESVTVKFLHWKVESSVAIVTLAATATGALIAGLFSLITRLRRWSRAHAVAGADRESAPRPEPGSPGEPPGANAP